MSTLSDHRKLGHDDNWTACLGQVTSCCNSHTSQMKHSVANYKAVFGQKYHPSSSVALGTCANFSTIWDHIKVSPDDRLEQYAIVEHDIADVEDDREMMAKKTMR